MTLPTDINIPPYVTRESHHMPSAPTAAGRRSVCCRLSTLRAPPHASDTLLPAKSIYQHLRRHQDIPTSTEARQSMPSTPNSNIKHITSMDHNSQYIIRGFCPFFFSGPTPPPFSSYGTGDNGHNPLLPPTHYPRLSTYFHTSFFKSNQRA